MILNPNYAKYLYYPQNPLEPDYSLVLSDRCENTG